MFNTFEELRKDFIKRKASMLDISCGPVSIPTPTELQEEDVYDTLMIFGNEQIAVNYCSENYGVSSIEIFKELHSEDSLRDEYGTDSYPRSSKIRDNLHLRELKDGVYLLWESY